jgi:uncharacterized protein YbdZ (MbtH family)
MTGLYDPDKEDIITYEVAVNHEEQYSIWPDYKEAPLGWKSVGKSGPTAECIEPVINFKRVPPQRSLASRLRKPEYAVPLAF